jgi:large subunit ribosomal protein L11
VITIYSDRSFSFILKTPPAGALIKKAIGLHTEKKKGSGSARPGKEQVGTINRAQVREIAEKKIQDTNAASIESCMRTIEGTARSMGIAVVD